MMRGIRPPRSRWPTFHVADRGPVAGASVLLRGQVRGEMVERNGAPRPGQAEAARVTAELRQPWPVLLRNPDRIFFGLMWPYA
jgi:hypothetical protein